MKKVMLVEDEAFILEGLGKIIDWEQLGLSVIHKACDGRQALELWHQEPVDIIVTDVSMPWMDGLELLSKIREEDERCRCIILTGYDDFEYARKAIRLDVENYILKPIDEEELENALKDCIRKLDAADRRRGNIEENMSLLQFLSGKQEPEEMEQYLRDMGWDGQKPYIYAAVMKLNVKSLKDVKISVITENLMESAEGKLKVLHISPDSLLLLTAREERTDGEVAEYIAHCQNLLESNYGVLSFVSISSPFTDYRQLPERYREAMKLQKYLLIDGYGSCIDPAHIHNRKSADIVINDSELRKMIFKEDKEGVINYLEDLFINNMQEEAAVENLYQMVLKVAVMLQDIRAEYKLQQKQNVRGLLEVIDSIYHAEDIFEIKVLLIGELVDIMDQLHVEESHYTPVVRQIMSEVQENYKEDMNLKTLAYKYHMNTSYLGQIFQREVGCSFSQYLSNTKNSIAKDLILNTNMRINDIAKEVGYSDTSYFYRKFKQCYGVSPASLREMKQY